MAGGPRQAGRGPGAPADGPAQWSAGTLFPLSSKKVARAINAASGDLPQNLPSRPNYRKVNPADTPIMIVALTSKTLQLSQMFDVANTILAQKISQVSGVGQVFVGGAQQPAVRVSVDPEALAGVNLSLEEVRTALARATVIDLLELIGPEEQFLFPTRSRRRVGPIRPNSLTQAMDYFGRRLTGQDEAERTWKLEPPTPHDLRRTVETRLASLRIPKEIRDRVLNHIPSDVGSCDARRRPLCCPLRKCRKTIHLGLPIRPH